MRSMIEIFSITCLCVLHNTAMFFFATSAWAETIYYSIRQMGFDGEASLTMVGPKDYKDHKTVLIVFKANGMNFSDEEDIYVDPSTYKPLFVERNFSLSVFGHGKNLGRICTF